ncbi:MAG TPA: hypothetical protein VF659_22290 [Pyrinomonadaceae bacterium]|jgi:hypothetical protein
MKIRNIPRTCCLLLLALALGACAEQPRPVSEERPAAAPTPSAQETPAAAAATPGAQTPAPAPGAARLRPSPAEVRAALARAYKGAVAFEEADGRAAVGDFNGDGAEDLVVAVRPAAGRVEELNADLANWIVYEPLTVRPPDPRDFDPHEGVQKLKPREGRPRVEAGDVLLVVLHGFGDGGWRNPEAQQTYLLKNVAGSELRTQAPIEAKAAARRKTPRLRGDVLRERLAGGEGFLYWTGAGYGWFGAAGDER